MNTVLRIVLVISLVPVALAGPTAAAQPSAPSVAAWEELSPERFENLVVNRQRLGFAGAEDRAWELLLSGTYDEDAYRRLGLLLSPPEADEVRRRIGVQHAMRPLEQYVETLSGYSGLVVDQEQGGRYRLLVTSLGEEELQRVRALTPAEHGGPIEVVRVSHTWDELVAAAKRLGLGPRTPIPALTFAAVRVDTAGNRLLVEVPVEQLAAARLYRRDLEDRLGVAVELIPAEPRTLQGCGSRGYCTDPMRAGIRIEEGGNTGPDCTMGFHVTVGTDAQFLSAGHCGKNHGNSWYHDGWGFVGSVQYNAYIDPNRVTDSMRVQILNSQTDALVYGASPSEAKEVVGQTFASQGQFICLSGEASGWSCGTVETAFLIYYSQTVGRDLYGADGSYASAGGDSGGPVVVPAQGPGEVRVWATGIHVASNGLYAPISYVLSDTGSTLITR